VSFPFKQAGSVQIPSQTRGWGVSVWMCVCAGKGGWGWGIAFASTLAKPPPPIRAPPCLSAREKLNGIFQHSPWL